jgi:hypothetical protein
MTGAKDVGEAMAGIGRSEHAQRVDAIHLRVQSNRTGISADLRHRDQITISFGAGTYRWLSERNLEHALNSLGRLLVTAWTRAYQATQDEAIREARGVNDQRDREFAEQRARITSRGASPDDRIRISARGMSDIQVSIADGTIRDIDETEFVDQFREATARLVHDYMRQVRALQDRYYG